MYIIGLLAFSEQVLDEVLELEQGLNQLGYAVHLEQMGFKLKSPNIGDYYYEKDSVILWVCRCFRDEQRCRNAIEGFIKTDVDAIVAMTKPALEIALQETQGSSIPIIFTHVTREPAEQAALELLRENGKVTGVWDTWLEMTEERLSLFPEIVPPPTAVHAIYNPDLPVIVAESDILRRAAYNLGLDLFLYEARSGDEVKQRISSLQTHKDHALILLSDPTTSPFAGLMGAVAEEQYIPFMGLKRDELERCGALFALDTAGAGNQVAVILDRILKDESPAIIPILEPTRKILAVNQQAAQDLGVIVSPAVLSRAQIILPAKERARLGSSLLINMVLTLFFLILIILIAAQFNVPFLVSLTLGSVIILTASLWFFLSRKIIDPIRKLTFAAVMIGSGDLNTPIGEVNVEDEIGTLARALRRMKSNLIDSYVEQQQMTLNLEQQVVELTEAYKALQETKQELELASRRIINAEDTQRFALTTYIHDEVLRPLDDLIAVSEGLGHPGLIGLALEVEQRIRQVRFDLSTPILKNVGIEIRRLTQETLPQIYSNGRQIELALDLAALDQVPVLEPANTFLIYRFVHGAVSNVYRHSKATRVGVSSEIQDNILTIRVSDNGQGFDPTQIENILKAGHYFFHDIHIRTEQLNGSFRIRSNPGEGAQLEISVPVH
jgi:putative tryptophan/tyrosine transport system substrate-binding protein